MTNILHRLLAPTCSVPSVNLGLFDMPVRGVSRLSTLVPSHNTLYRILWYFQVLAVEKPPLRNPTACHMELSSSRCCDHIRILG